jgi:hypothetical protein
MATFLTLDSRLSTFNSSLAGMHRKSMEAADKLKDCDQSDGESRDHSERSNSSTSLIAIKKSAQNQSQQLLQQQQQQQITCNEKIVSLSPPISSSAIYNSVLSSGNGKCNIKEEMRTSSIASLRAKALEHCAKVNQIANKSSETSGLFATNNRSTTSNSPTAHYHHSPSAQHHVY